MNLSCVRGVWGILCGIWTTLWEKKVLNMVIEEILNLPEIWLNEAR